MLVCCAESAAWLHSFLEGQSIWLAGSPAGIKLHRPLAEFYSACLRLASVLTWRFHSSLLDVLAHIWVPLLVILCLTGASTFLATLNDLIYIAHLQLTVFYAGKCTLLTPPTIPIGLLLRVLFVGLLAF